MIVIAGGHFIYAAAEARDQLLYGLAANGAGVEGLIGHFLEELKGLVAGFARFVGVLVFVNGHVCVSTSLTQGHRT